MHLDFINLRFDFVSLKAFLVVADTENIREASDLLHLSIPAVSRRIAELEREFGQQLFKRHSRGLEITNAGIIFAERVRETFASLKLLHEDMDRLKAGDIGSISISSNGSALVNGLAQHMSLFLKKYPNVDIDVHERLTPEVFEDLRKGTADIGFIANTLNIPDGLNTTEYLTDQLVLVAPKGHRFADKTSVEFNDILGCRMIGIEELSSLTRLVREVGKATNVQFSYKYMASTNEVARHLVANGLGVAILPEVFVKSYQDLLDIIAIPIAEDWATRKISMVYQSEKALTTTADLFFKWIKERSQSTVPGV